MLEVVVGGEMLEVVVGGGMLEVVVGGWRLEGRNPLQWWCVRN